VTESNVDPDATGFTLLETRPVT